MALWLINPETPKPAPQPFEPQTQYSTVTSENKQRDQMLCDSNYYRSLNKTCLLLKFMKSVSDNNIVTNLHNIRLNVCVMFNDFLLYVHFTNSQVEV